MRLVTRFLFLCLCFFSTSALAQTPKGQIDDIVVVSSIGTLDDSLVGLIKVTIGVSVGDALESVVATDIQGQVESTGFFQANSTKVAVVLENGRNILRITVTPNPTIEKVEIKGNSIVTSEQILSLLEQRYNVTAGVMVSNLRLEEARIGLGAIYRQSIGFPFTLEIKLELSKPKDNKVIVTYTINENATVREVKTVGATLVPSAEIIAQFSTLVSSGKFDIRIYFQGLRAVNDLYSKKGYGANTPRGYIGSGPNIELSSLENGVLTIIINELKIAAIDATALGIDPSTLSQKPGDFFNYQTLIKETRNLARGRDKQVGIVLEPSGDNSVIVTFTIEDAPAGPIQTIRILGNTVIPTDRIRRLVTQKLGDTYNAQIAREIDFTAISQAYTEAGYTIVSTPDVSYADGVYTVRVLEVKLVGYELKWRNAHRSQDRIILRELPKAGGLLDFNKIRNSFRNIQALGVLKDIRPDIKPAPSGKPEEVILVLELEEGSTGEVLPGLTFSTLDGFAGNLTYSERNAWGVGHRMNVTFQAQPNEAGQAVSGGFSYSIPWLDFNFLDFATNRTEISVYFSSNVASKRVVEFTRAFVDLPTTANINEGSRYFSTRNTGAGISLGRQLFSNFTIRIAFDFQYEQNFLETPGDVGTRPFNNTNNDAAVAAVAGTSQGVPLNNLTAYVSLSGEFNTKNREDFPTQGWLVQGSLGYGFGTDRIDSTLPGALPRPLSWTQGTFGFRTYLGLGWDSQGKFGVGGDDRNFALAFRFNAGALFGAAPSSRIFSIGGATASEAINLRGLDFGDLRGDVYYTGSLELRFDFGLQTAFTYGLLGIAWIDFGNAWGGDSQYRRDRVVENVTTRIPFGMQFGYGLGLQINLGFGGIQLPAIRLDYGWSAWNPGGKFYFRLGFPF